MFLMLKAKGGRSVRCFFKFSLPILQGNPVDDVISFAFSSAKIPLNQCFWRYSSLFIHSSDN